MKIPPSFFTYFSAISVNFLSYGGGLGYGWSSPALPKLSGEVDPDQNQLSRPATLAEQSWIASLLSLGAMCSPFLCEYVSGKLGRKISLLLFSLPMIGGYVILIFADEVVHFYIGRFLIGITEGSIFSTIPVYSAEISENHNRGTIGAIMFLFVSLGHFTSSVVGPNVSLQLFSIISLVPCIIFFVSFGLFSPETPYYYVIRNKFPEAEKSLKQLRKKEDVSEEMSEIIKCVTEMKSNKNISVLKEIFTDKSSLKAFVLSLLLMLFQQFTGLIYIIDYNQKIFDSAETPLSGDKGVVIVMAVQVAAILFSTNVIDKINRKTLLLLSLTSIFFLHTTLGSFFYLKQENFNVQYASWIPIACLMLFITAYQLGICPISYIFPAEILKPNVKSFGIMLVCCIGLLAEFLIATFLPVLEEHVGFYVPFWIFAVISLIAIVFVYFFIPETRSKSFLEIQESLEHKIK
ncbi:facilitated trehalose transporter Tret1-like [Sitophilus oryzae]|uniref:Facilitated trehalose transporter Tret1-like n=1 Tax=Sitophilus oryzae TaxID=7048 RepID=A0A6J2XUF0_SITOR|nr:facilitated trehalose transporter Tret1-like [Sitophilus oryzae]